MRSLRPLLVPMLILLVGIASLAAQTATAKPKGPVMRKPFTLRLKVDKDQFQEFQYEKQPYVSDNEVYLFSGDKFGVNLVVKGDEVVEVRYQPDTTKADVVFGFEQPKELQNGIGMALTIDNKMKLAVGMEVMGSVPGKKETFKDKILPVQAGKSDLEWWPHPIVQLVLGNLRLATAGATQPSK